MFEMLGKMLDDFIDALIKRNREMFWYKVYAYIRIKFMIKRGKFENRKHFERFMKIVERQVWRWRTDKLRKVFPPTFLR